MTADTEQVNILFNAKNNTVKAFSKINKSLDDYKRKMRKTAISIASSNLLARKHRLDDNPGLAKAASNSANRFAAQQIKSRQELEQIIPLQTEMKDSMSDVNAMIKSNTKQRAFNNKVMQGGAQGLVNNATNINKLGAQYQNFGSVMKMPIDNWRKFNNEGGEFNSKGARLGNTVRMLTHGMKGFRMEMLGVMFFGQMLQKTFSALMKPTLEIFGVFDIWRIMLQTLFIPIVSALFPLFMELVTWLMNLSPEAQMAIGAFVVLMTGIGAVLATVGQFALGIGSLILMFSGPAGLAGAATGAATGIAGIAGAIPGIGIAIGIAVALWKTDLGGFRDFVTTTFEVLAGSLEDIFNGIKKVISGIWNTMTSILEGDWETAWENMQKVAEGLDEIFTAIMEGMALSIANVFIWLFNTIKDLYNNVIVNGVMFGLQKLAEKVGMEDLAKNLEEAQKTNSLINGLQQTAYLTREDMFGKEFGEGSFSGNGGASGSWGGDVINTITVQVQDKSFFEKWSDDFAKKQRDELMRLTGS